MDLINTTHKKILTHLAKNGVTKEEIKVYKNWLQNIVQHFYCIIMKLI